jgi:hypothetical protein
MIGGRKSSAGRTVGLVVCPSCHGAEVDCELCHGVRRLGVDAAVQWAMTRGSKPPGSVPAPPTPKSTPGGDSDAVLLNAIQAVLHQLQDVEDPARANELAERAKGLKALILTWCQVKPSAADREAINRKVLGLHVALGRLPHKEKKT